MKPFSKIISDITKTVGASGVQFVITLCTTPIMTRLYDPAAYATFGIINSAATAVVGIGLLSLTNAYPMEKTPARHAEVLQTMLLLLAGLMVLSVVAAAGFGATDALHPNIHIPALVLAMFPLLVLTFGIRQIMIAVAVERAHFGKLALRQILEPICARGGAIALGAGLGGNPAFILIAASAGHIVSVSMMIKSTLIKQWRSYLHYRFKPMETIRRHADFVLYNTASQQAPPLALLGIQMAMAALFSGSTAGHYILATSIIALPVNLIGLTTAPVVYRHFIEISRTAPKELAQHLMVAMTIYLLAGLCIFAPIFFFGEPIFRFVFGTVWEESGRIAATLSLSYVAWLASIGVQSIFRVTRRMKLQFVLEIMNSMLSLGAAILCFKFMTIENAIRGLAVIWLLRNLVLLAASVVVVLQYVKRPHAND